MRFNIGVCDNRHKLTTQCLKCYINTILDEWHVRGKALNKLIKLGEGVGFNSVSKNFVGGKLG